MGSKGKVATYGNNSDIATTKPLLDLIQPDDFKSCLAGVPIGDLWCYNQRHSKRHPRRAGFLTQSTTHSKNDDYQVPQAQTGSALPNNALELTQTHPAC